MAIAHLCMQCGMDLAYTRPVREPHYGWRLITCPRCGTHVVRRSHPVWEKWLWFRRIDWALTVMVVHTLIGLGLLAATLSMPFLVWMTILTFKPTSSEWTTAAAWIGAAFVASAVTTGAWLTIAFRHLRRPAVWFGWTMLLFLLLAITCLLISRQTIDLYGEVRYLNVPAPSESPISPFGLIGAAAAVIVASLIIAPAGIPVGNGVQRMMDAIRRAKWRYRRRKRRLVSNA